MPRGSHNKTQGKTAVCVYERCGKEFEQKQDTQRYCRPACRVQHHRRKSLERRIRAAADRIREAADEMADRMVQEFMRELR